MSVSGEDGKESVGISLSKPVKTHFLSENPSCIAWHPSNSYRILVAGQFGGLQVLSLHESLPMGMSCVIVCVFCVCIHVCVCVCVCVCMCENSYMHLFTHSLSLSSLQ
jgi:hypothetical protein